jgi:hypothetical protein
MQRLHLLLLAKPVHAAVGDAYMQIVSYRSAAALIETYAVCMRWLAAINISMHVEHAKALIMQEV